MEQGSKKPSALEKQQSFVSEEESVLTENFSGIQISAQNLTSGSATVK